MAVRPIILNGISAVAERADLADRAIAFELESISDRNRRTEAEVWAEFRQVWPQVFGALLDAVSCALRDGGKTRLAERPRMADFAMRAAAERRRPAGTLKILSLHMLAIGRQRLKHC